MKQWAMLIFHLQPTQPVVWCGTGHEELIVSSFSASKLLRVSRQTVTDRKTDRGLSWLPSASDWDWGAVRMKGASVTAATDSNRWKNRERPWLTSLCIRLGLRGCEDEGCECVPWSSIPHPHLVDRLHYHHYYLQCLSVSLSSGNQQGKT